MNKLFLGLLVLTLLACPLSAARKALVIGNSDYSNSPLRNPVNDARAMDKTLRDLGFQVTVGYDVKNYREMLRLIQDFGAGLKEGSVGLFYYAGHGVQYNGVNYLIPTQADIRRDQDIELEGVSLNRVLAEMEYAQNDLNIIILDACRNNPYASRLRSPMRGLAATTAKNIPGLLIAYATAPDDVAEDGTGSNGIYTEELLKNIKTPGLSLSQILMKTREGVISRTGGDQIPWDSSSLTKDFYFASATGNVPATLLPEEAQVQTVSNYGSIIVSSSQDADVYLDGNPKGKVSPAADLKISNVTVGNHSLEARSSDKSESKSMYVGKNQENVAHFAWTPDNMVYVEGGSFMMGSNDGDDEEKPVHKVTVSSFWIGKYEVTQAEYSQYMGPIYSWSSELGLGDNYPAYNVSWYAILKYCNLRSLAEGFNPCYTISGSTNPANWGTVPTSSNPTWDAVICNWEANGYRMPTEAEWEFAARGGVKSKGYKYSGSNNLGSVAWYDGNSNDKTHEVGTKAANELGIYDMSGNIGEWCWDWFDLSNYTKNLSLDPQGADAGSWRVLRIGSWFSEEFFCRVAFRFFSFPGGTSSSGFRVARAK